MIRSANQRGRSGRLIAAALSTLAVFVSTSVARAAGGDFVPSGRELAASYCTRCHSLPVPNQLPKEAWPELFELMNELVRSWPDPGTHAEKTLPKLDPWDSASNQSMLAYFIANAQSEDEIRSAIEKPAAITLRDFEFQPAPVGLPRGHFLTMLRYDRRNRAMLLGLGQTVSEGGEVKLLKANAFAMVGLSGTTTSLTKHASPPVHADLIGDTLRLTLIGDMAKDTGEGEVIEFSTRSGEITQTLLLADLPRPVGSRTADFDGDGFDDLLVSGFGGNRGTGETAIYWGGAASAVATKQVIFPGSGSLDGEVADFDGDGKPDILLLIAQRTQALRLYRNRGERRFEEHTLIQRPVGWGFMDLEVADIDSDGDLDVITAAGNNMEFSTAPLKRYHGIRVWLNETGKPSAAGGHRVVPSLREAYFYPLFGAGQVLSVDADGDGALDLAATSFAPDWKQQWPETFVLLTQAARNEQTARLEFQPYHVAPAHWRRWTYLTKGLDRAAGGSQILLGDTWLPFGAPSQAPARLQRMLDRPTQIYSLQHSPRRSEAGR